MISPIVGTIHPAPTDEEAAAIAAGIEVLWQNRCNKILKALGQTGDSVGAGGAQPRVGPRGPTRHLIGAFNTLHW